MFVDSHSLDLLSDILRYRHSFLRVNHFRDFVYRVWIMAAVENRVDPTDRFYTKK